jgi:hypothetical protein
VRTATIVGSIGAIAGGAVLASGLLGITVGALT